ncbi:MFS transporter [Sphingomonas sp. GB1N7]|uniref:MFS transporter n=1 Tax=Parasphingomonas caseinilytica TaxID=3096158 RepID=UPI002FC6147A
MADDPREIIDREPMSRFQWVVVAIMVGLNALDGFDVLSISFASPGIVKDWGIDRAALGLVLSMELIGMAVGSIVLGGVADRFGRRRTILGCLVVMAAGMFAASTAHDVVTLSVWRVLTGLGIGGMLATTNAAVSEASNIARRNLAVVIMAAGYPLGAIVGGSISSALLRHFDWPVVFQFGGIATLCFIPIVLWRAPESIAFELQRRRPGTLAAVNRTLARMGHRTVDALPPEKAAGAAMPLAALFSPALVRITLLITLAYTAQLMTFYFLLKWIPKIVVDMGFAPSSAGSILVFANCGGLVGSLLLGLLTAKIKVRTLTIATMAVSAIMVAWFGRGQGSYGELAWIAAITGFFTNGGIVGLYALLAWSFPTDVRATATGFAIGVGRGGSALAPALAGFLFAAGYGLQTVAILMASGSVIALLALLALGNRGEAT